MADVLKHLIQSVRRASVFNPEAQAAPLCILWPDGDRQWEPVAARLQAELPEMFVLGSYDIVKRTGPSIWLRCVIANKAPRVEIPAGLTPVIYLPGVSRQDLRPVENCPDNLKPLAELQYSGVIWSQINAKDWTILAFLKSSQGGLGLDVANDNATRQAMKLALYRLLDEDLEFLKGKHLDKDYFNTLLTGGDPVRDMLQWLDQGDAFKAGRDENTWIGFVEVCKSQLGFDPANDGNLKGAELLAGHRGAWLPIWERFCEAPRKYTNIPSQIRKCKPPIDDIFWYTDDDTCNGWPQWNDDHEKKLRQELMAIENFPPHDARKKILEMEKLHCRRRSLVWAELGEAPLACAMESLALLAELTGNPSLSGTANEIAEEYRKSGWKVDDAELRALSCVNRQEDIEAVKSVIRSVYKPWVESSARYLQKVVEKDGYPGNRTTKAISTQKKSGECILFIDGLRFDVARRLSDLLSSKGLKVIESLAWAAIPTVTATGKPAVTPVAHLITGQSINADFEPCVASTGQSLKGGHNLQKLLAEEGWLPQIWREFGSIDREGHDRGWKLARYLDRLLGEISEQIEQLLAFEFRTIRVITDHGWLLMPGGLPKTALPSCLTENKWGRCAVLKPGASADERLFPWFWNPLQEFALADGISCYRAGLEYAHGGLSLQECLTLQLEVTTGKRGRAVHEVTITDVSWKGFRCNIHIEGDASGLLLDLRMHPGNSSTSVLRQAKLFNEDGRVSVLVDNSNDENLEGQEATLVVLDNEGRLVAQRKTVIGE